MEITEISRTDAISSTWAGGTTTEFFIYPPGSSYKERNFQIRISSATVDVEESEFTMLPDYDRIITPLTDYLHLSFQETADTYDLKPLESAFFDGAYHTHSKGRATDFNVMFRKGMKATYAVLSTSSQLNRGVHRFIYVPAMSTQAAATVRLDSIRLKPDTVYYMPSFAATVPLFLEEPAVKVIYVTVTPTDN